MARSKIIPWKHQLQCAREIASARQLGQPTVLYVMASGLGKTFTSAFDFRGFRRANQRARLLFLAHQNDLLEQALQSYQQILGDRLTYGFFNGEVKAPQAEAVFATFQSMRTALFGPRPKGQRRLFSRNRFDYIVVDESHHGKAPTYEDVIGYFKPQFMLGMTATPNRMDLQNIREIFGQEVYTLELAEALASGLLTPVDYRIMADEIVDQGKLKIPPHLVSIQQLNRIFFSRRRDKAIVAKILEKIAELTDPQVLVFTASIKHAERFAKLMPGAMAVHSDLPDGVRRERMGLIRKGLIRTTVTVDQFNEGVDIPDANVLVFLRSTWSKTIWLQQLGRGLRKVPGKIKVLVLDFVANCERLALIDQFRREMIAKVRTRKGGGPRHEFQVNWGSVVFEERAREVVDLLRKVQVGLTPEVLLDYLREYYRKNGKAPTTLDLRTSKGMPSARSYRNYFGNLAKACQAAGIPLEDFAGTRQYRTLPRAVRQRFLLQCLIKFYQRTDRAPTSADLVASKGMPGATTYRKYFGSLAKACKRAGIPKQALPREIKLRKLPAGADRKRFLLQCLIKFYQRTDRAPTSADCSASKGLPSEATYRKYFGSLAKACKRAGIPKQALPREVKLRKLPAGADRKRFLLQCLIKFYQRTDRAPTTADLVASKGMPGATTYLKYFGSMAKACKRAGIPQKAMSAAQRMELRRRTQESRKINESRKEV